MHLKYFLALPFFLPLLVSADDAFIVERVDIPTNGLGDYYIVVRSEDQQQGLWVICEAELGPDSPLQADMPCHFGKDQKPAGDGLRVWVQQPPSRDPRADGVNFILDSPAW